MSTLERTFNIVLAIVTTLLVIIALLFIAHYFYNLFALLGIVLVLTYILLAPVNWVQRSVEWVSEKAGAYTTLNWMTKGTPEANPRILAVIVVYFVFFMTLTLGSIQFVPRLQNELEAFGDNFKVAVERVSGVLVDWSDEHLGRETLRKIFGEDIRKAGLTIKPSSLKDVPREQRPQVAEIAKTMQEKAVIEDTVSRSTVAQAVHLLEAFIQKTIDNIVLLVTGTLNGFIYFLSVLLLVFFFLLDGRKLHDDFLRVLPSKGREIADYFLGSFHQVMFAFIKGQVLLGIMTGIYMFFVYSFLGVPYPFFLGSLFAVAEFLPVVGTYLGITPAIFVALFSGEPLNALWIFAFSYAYQTVKDNIIAPKVVGNVMGLHPMVIIISLMVCAQVAGILGVLLALPVASAINVILRYITSEMDKTETTAGGAA